MAAPQASSRLEMLQARFQQKQLQEKEQKLLQLYDQQQQRAYQVVQRNSAGSTVRTTTTSTSHGGKVRQMFDERRNTKGIDRSYPLEPLENKLRKQTNVNGVAMQRSGNLTTVNRQCVSMKRVARADVNSNINSGKPVVSYQEEISGESFGPSIRRHDDEDEYGVENRVAAFANGYYRHEADNEQEEALDHETMERNRMMAKIHLMGFDESLKHRVRNDLESEEFPEYLMADVPDKLSKRNVTKKLSQAEARLERFKNANAKRNNTPKQSTTIGNSMKKRSEQTVSTKANSRRSEIAGTSPTGTRSGSSRIAERSERILENAKNPLPYRTRVPDEINDRRRESSDMETFSRKDSQSFSNKATKTDDTARIYPRSNGFKSVTSDGKIFVRRSASPQFFCREPERSATAMSIDRQSDSPGSPLFDRRTLTKRRSPFFLNEFEQSRKTNGPKSMVRDRGISLRPTVNSQYLLQESETVPSTDRETSRSKSPEWSKETLTKQKMNDFDRKFRTSSLDRETSFKSPSYEEDMLKKRSSSPQFFCKESERSGTTMSIDHAFREPRSSSYDQGTFKKQTSPYFFNESEYHKTRESAKSPIWDREILSRRSTNPQHVHHESKRPETTLNTDRETTEFKSLEWDRKTFTKQKTDDKKLRTSTSLDRKTSSKSPSYKEEILKKRNSSPQFFCKESERSGTTMSIDHTFKKPRSSSYDRETLKKRTSPFFLNESERYRRTNGSKSPVWNREILSRQSTSPQYVHHESKRSETALSTDREISRSKSPERSKETLTKQKKDDFDRKFRTSSLDRKTSSKSPLFKEKMLKKRSSSPQFFCKESERSATTMSIDHTFREPRSSSYDRETLKKRTNPFFLNESEQYRRTNESKSPVWNREILSRQSTSPQYVHHESKRSETALSTDREISRSKSPEWSKETLTKQKKDDFDRKFQISSLDRKTSSKSPSFKEEMLKKRNSGPQFFCKESERSGTTMSIDHTFREPRSSSYDRGTFKKQTSPYFFNESEYRKTRESSKSPIWDREILSRSTSPQYIHHESKRSETALSTDRETSRSKSPEWSKGTLTKQKTNDFDRKLRTSTSLDRKTSSTSPSFKEEMLKKRSSSPQFFCKESERSGTTMSIDHAFSEPRSSSYDRGTSTKQSTTPRLCRKNGQQSSRTASINREYEGSKSFRATRDKRSTSPQFFCRESEKSATTMLIEPKSSSRDSKISKQRNDVPDVSYKRSMKPLPSVNTKISSTRDRYTASPSFTKHEVKKALRENEIPSTATGTRRSSKISEISATSNSSIVSLKYGLEFDNILQSTGLVRKFMKSHDGKQRKDHQSQLSPLKRNIKNVNYTVRDNQSRNKNKASPLFQKARSPSVESRKRATPECPRKSLTPTEVDVEIQEITMTDHRIERDKLRKMSSPIPKRQINGTYTRSLNNRPKFKISLTYPVRKTQRQRASILEYSVRKDSKSKGDFSRDGKGSKDRRNDRSAISLSKLDSIPASESSQRIITRAEEDENRMKEAEIPQTWNRSVKNQVENVAVQTGKREDRRRSTSRSPNQTRNRTARERADGSKTSPGPFKERKYSGGTVSPFSYNSEKRTKGTRAKFDRSQTLRSAHLVKGTVRDRNLSVDNVYNRGRSRDKDDVAVDEVDDGIDMKYRMVVETALNEKIKGPRKIPRRNSADQIANKKVSQRETIRASMKSNTSKGTISATKDCGRQHDVKFRISPRVSPLKRTAEISRAVDTKILPCQRAVSKADQNTKFFTYSVKDRKRESAKKLTELSNKVNVKREIEKTDDAADEFSKMRRENKFEKDFERMDSVESALKRFDSIDAKVEHLGPTSFQTSSEISLQMMDGKDKISTEEPIVKEKLTVIPPREATNNTTLKSTLKSPVDRDLKVKNVRKSDSKILGKHIRSSGRSTKIGDSIESKQRYTQTRSPKCKRRLFGSDWQKEIEETRSKSSYAKGRKKENCTPGNFRFRTDGTASKVRSSKDFDRVIAKGRKRLEETPMFSVKALRSIEDIRKSIVNEQDVLITTEESRSAIANRRSASRENVDARGSIPATDAARNVFLGSDPARLTKVKSCVSRITKSPSPDSAARKQHETNTRATRGSASTSPSKSPDIVPRHTSTESKNQEAKPSRKSTITKGADSIGNKATTTGGTIDAVDGVVLQNGSPHEFTTKSSDAFVIDYDDRSSKEDDAIPPKKSSTKKSSMDKQQTASGASGRPISSGSSTSSADSPQGQVSSTKGKMVPRRRTATENLVACSICKRRFTRDRIDFHKKICETSMSKTRKPFDSVMTRVRGTDLESFVKRNRCKIDKTKERIGQKPNNWRRQHEDFINTIRSAKQVQTHLAAGGNLRDLPPPPPSDTSDYIQCPHCRRRFSPPAAERHIPKCQNMLHNKPAPARAPRR